VIGSPFTLAQKTSGTLFLPLFDFSLSFLEIEEVLVQTTPITTNLRLSVVILVTSLPFFIKLNLSIQSSIVPSMSLGNAKE